jgi:uncharacterized protein (DUF983 family)
MQSQLEAFTRSFPDGAFHRCPRCKHGYWTHAWERGAVTCPREECKEAHRISRRGVAVFNDDRRWD